MTTSTAIIVLVLLLAGNAFFVASEFAVVSARRDQLEPLAAEGSKSAKYALKGIENVSTSLAATQLGITACSLLIGAAGEPAIAHLIEVPMHWLGVPEALLHPIALVIALLIVTFLHMILGEMVPKNIAIAVPSRAAQVLGPVLHGFVVVFRPFIWVMNATANLLVRWLFRVEPKDEVASAFTSDDVRGFVAESGREGLLDNDEIRLLTGALNFENKTAADVALPLTGMRTVPSDITVSGVELLCAETGYSRFPVRDENERLMGYIHTKDVLGLPETARERPIPPAIVRRFARVAPGDKLRKVTRTMQAKGAHFALLGEVARDSRTSDESVYIVALEDVLEELVGEVRDATSKPDQENAA
ncbi:hemolysin family protein [Kocuria rhizophila]|uniref:hemolysin family protein n=1 Tax=Kocuria rhizophila TaxID=72000 RepID=UPI000C877522|nr:hemolysin family protein [Kocuria rhizophila]MCR4526775.1 hemolysin family protein [Kocuria rhizophila]MCT1917373.1 hemolysin family protein [Kocuria rhizophila]MCT1956891.1 hemolysin family protein [Kocuria rhizophila]MCT2073332.1 hemolysin family protein [Kocuria rhizophila]PMR90388.1 hypothetical protein C1H83_08130 [Kocuria rhizophila]